MKIKNKQENKNEKCIESKLKGNVSKILWLSTSIYIVLMLISNILAGRLISIFGLSLSGAILVFPFTYILSDIFTEVYGFNINKKIIWLSFISNLVMVILFTIVLKLPYPDAFNDAEAYKIVLGTTPRVFIGSLLGFLAGNFLNSIILSKLKVITKGKYLALRTISSTIVGEGIDTLIFVTVVFLGTLPNNVLIMMIINQAVFKILIETIFTPVTYKVVAKMKKIEQIDTYDNDIKYNLI